MLAEEWAPLLRDHAPVEAEQLGQRSVARAKPVTDGNSSAYRALSNTRSPVNHDLPEGISLHLQQLATAAKGLLLIAIVFALHSGAVIFVPVAFGFLLYLLLAPMHALMTRAGVPRGMAALALIVLTVTPFLFSAYALSGPAAEWLRVAPTSLADIGTNLRELSQPLEKVKDASAAVTEAVEGITGARTGTESVVTVREPGLVEVAVEWLPDVLASLGIGIAVALLLLLDRDRALTAVFTRSRKFTALRRARHAVQKMKRDVSQYLMTIVVINSLLGVLSATTFTLLGLPNPILWGVVAGLLNFAPYVGPAVTAGLVAVAGLAEFASVTAALGPALGFVLLTIIEGQIITPIVLGRRLASQPILMLLAVLAFAALWGVAGALMAVPLFFTGRIWWNLALVKPAPPGDAASIPEWST